MTNAEREQFSSYLHRNPPVVSVNIFENDSFSAVSDLSNVSSKFIYHNQHQKVIALNYSSGNSAMVLDAYVGEKDLMEARERNRRKKQEGNELQSKFERVKTVTAMYHFNTLGCVIGKDALQKKKQIDAIQKAKNLEMRKKEEKEYNERKVKHDSLILQNIPDEKLTMMQLKTLLAFKKRKNDKGFSHLKKGDLLTLWTEWKHRQVQEPAFNTPIVQSVAGATPMATTDTVITNGMTADVQEV